MKILVFSDSHGDVDTMERIAGIIKPDMIFHLGDLIKDAVELEQRIGGIPVEFVRGNCDIWSTMADEKLFETEGKRIMLTHGDKYGVRTGYSTIIKKGRKKADIVLCGHTHMSHLVKKKNFWLMNPGKIGKNARGPFKPSFGIIEIGDTVDCYIEKVNAII